MQKLLFIFFFALLFFGCDGVEDGLIDPSLGEFNVTNIEAPNTLSYSGTDTKLTTSITFSDSKALLSVWIKVVSQDGTFDITYHKDMTKAGDNEYTTSIAMDSLMPSINYTIDYFYQTESQDEKKIASHDFTYDNMQGNVAPITSNPLFYYVDESPTLRDTLENDKYFVFAIQVTDENGLGDIDSVYADFYSPNNPSAMRVILYDDGTSLHGDLVEGDGIYSLINKFHDASGDRKFEFWARDRRGKLSNMVTHNVVVK
ncbi:MAG: hypothetical protein KKF62_08825 [Bacteroidetes bacterium]|nr:hypothetical protein [Bacteroidota bacterium]MBU1115819.1 hypothetical protein [Bacteroidota bacterium]MBU1800212.1 hypothetical protein [Bacteroidota bacterium]